jgi:hypothetical protein
MSFEELQKAWQSQGAGPRLNIEANLLLREIRHNEKNFDRIIFWRDFREIGLAVVMAGFFMFGPMADDVWSSFLMALGCLWVAGFMIVDRWRQRQDQPVSNDPLRACIEASQQKLGHQIWLLRNVFWWYLLPLQFGFVSFVVSFLWELELMARQPENIGRNFRLVTLGVMAVVVLVWVLVFWGVYRLNQHAVRKTLEPRRQELDSLLVSLNLDEDAKHETTS